MTVRSYKGRGKQEHGVLLEQGKKILHDILLVDK